MEYSIKASSIAHSKASIEIKGAQLSFGITSESFEEVANPAELFLGSFSACILKNVERFSEYMKFDYSKAEIVVSATRLEKPPKLDQIHYELSVYTSDKELNVLLLKKNIEKFGTIFNTVKGSCSITGEIILK
ncbi:MAG: OsmC family protein [Bacteroidota bacterium]